MLMVRDLGSLNGTFVGETRIAEQAMPVKPGDLITVGPVTFRAVYRASGSRPRRRSGTSTVRRSTRRCRASSTSSRTRRPPAQRAYRTTSDAPASRAN